MSTSRSGLILGYHGCLSSLARETVLLNQTLKKSKNVYDWLGHGVYFWEHNLQRAWEFANEKWQSKNNADMPGVIGATIDLGYCLDLLDNQNTRYLQFFHSTLKFFGIDLPKNSALDNNNIYLRRELDCFVLELFHRWRKSIGLPAYDSVRHAFEEGPALYENSAFREKTHIQICVRNIKCVKAYFLPIEKYTLMDPIQEVNHGLTN